MNNKKDELIQQLRDFTEDEETLKKKKKLKEDSVVISGSREIVERVDIKLYTEDGRQLLT